MKPINKEEFLKDKDCIKDSVFIYPTDTIYGVGCDARDPEKVARIRKIKGSDQPFSVIAPNKEWIRNNCEINDIAEEWLDKLPGPYTLIIKLKNPGCVAKNVLQGKQTLGIRMPDNWFSKIVAELGYPVITTSANRTGQAFMTTIEDLDKSIAEEVDHIIYDGELKGTPSTLVIIDKDVEMRKR